MSWSSGIDRLTACGGVERGNRKRRSVRLRFVEGLRAWRFAGHLELSDLVWKPVGRERRGSICHLKVQMGHDRVAGVSYQADYLTGMDMLTAMNFDAPRLHVGIESIVPVTQIENYGVAVRSVERDVCGVITGCLLRLPVDNVDDKCVGNR